LRKGREITRSRFDIREIVITFVFRWCSNGREDEVGIGNRFTNVRREVQPSRLPAFDDHPLRPAHKLASALMQVLDLSFVDINTADEVAE
jgi:hypothetical protein